jgi:hypothetical protein
VSHRDAERLAPAAGIGIGYRRGDQPNVSVISNSPIAPPGPSVQTKCFPARR